MNEYWAGNSYFMVSTAVHAKNKRQAAKIFRDQYGFDPNYIVKEPPDNDPLIPAPVKAGAKNKK